MNKYNNYISAEITLFWTARTENNSGQLIFAITELIPKNQMASAPLGGGNSKYLYCNINKNRQNHIYCRRYFCEVDQAVKCFEQHDWSSLPDGPIIGTCSSFKREPSDEVAVVLPQGQIPLDWQPNSLSMVLPNRSASFRAYCYIDNLAETKKLYSDSVLGKIQGFVKKYCGVDLKKYSEYIGANIICMQNPLLWNVQTSILESEGIYRFLLMPRSSHSLDPLYATVRTSHPFGTVSSKLISVQSEVFEFPIQKSSSKSELCLWDKDGNLLEIRPLKFFRGQPWFSTNHRVLPNGQSVAIWPKNYYSSRSKEVSALEKAEKERSYHLLEEKKEFCYFCAGEDTKAQNFIGSILASTGLQISICDPYLDQIGFKNYVKGWVRCEKLYLFVAGEWLRKIDAASGKTYQQQVEDIVDQMILNNEVRQIKIFKITGDNNGFVHDRFIIVDENVWSLGASLNHFGKKDTTIAKSPNPKVFIDRVEEWKNGKTPLVKEWIK